MHMANFTVNVISEKKDRRVPVALAGQIMVDIQDLFTHVGEYIAATELHVQNVLDRKFDEKFRIYMDPNDGISFNASTDIPETSGRGNLVDDALDLMEKTLDAMGSGTGSYWIEDNYKDALYRNMVIFDIVALYQDLSDWDGYSLVYGATKDLKKFGKVDVGKLSAFIKGNGLSCRGYTYGIVGVTPSKSGRYPKYYITYGDKKAKLIFADPNDGSSCEPFVDKTPVLISGTLAYSEDGDLVSVSDASKVIPATKVEFSRLVSSTGDVKLKHPLNATVSYEGGKWVLRNEEVGISESGDTWDAAVQMFHDYFVFVWVQYADIGDEGLSEEELEVKKYLLGLIV